MNTIASSKQDLVVQLAEDFVEKHRRGEFPSLDEYRVKYPELATEVESLIEALLLMEKLGSKQSHRNKISTADIPEQLGEYQLIRELGRGGMGVVYEAVQVSLNRHVALKVLPKQALSNVILKERFLREARTAASLHHSHIVPVHGVGEQDGICYFVMQLIDGISCDHILRLLHTHHHGKQSTEHALLHTRKSGFTQADTVESDEQRDKSCQNWIVLSFNDRCREVARIGLDIAEALAYAHQQGVLHRDIKPGNIIIDRNNHPWLNDFGLARPMDDSNLTASGQVVGTLRYLPPERFDGLSGVEGDIYSLGLTLYELITCEMPYSTTDQAKLVKLIHDETPTSLLTLQPTVSADLNTIIMKCLAKNPNERYRLASELAHDLRAWLAGEPILARPLRWWEKAGRWVKSNPLVASLLSLIFLLLTAGLLTSSYLWWQAEQERNDAIIARNSQERSANEARIAALQADMARDKEHKAALQAQEQATIATQAKNEAEALNKFFREQILEASRPGKRGKDITLAQALEKSESSIHQYFEDVPKVEIVVRNWIAETYRSLGKYRQSEGQLRQSKALLEDLKANNTHSYAVVHASIANALFNQGRWAESIEYFEKYYELRKTIDVKIDKHLIDQNYVVALSKVHQQKDAYELSKKAYDDLTEAVGKEHIDTLAAQVNLAYISLMVGRFTQATKHSQDVLSILKKTEQSNHPVGLKAKHMLLKCNILLGKAQQAVDAAPQLLADFQDIVGENHTMTLELMNDIGIAYSRVNLPEKALEIQIKAAELFEEHTGMTNPETLTAWANVAISYTNQLKFKQALPILERVVKQRRILQLHKDVYALNALGLFANCLALDQQYGKAKAVATEYLILTKNQPALVNRSLLSAVHRTLGVESLSRKSYEESERWFLECWNYQKTAKDISDNTKRQTTEYLVQLYDSWGKPDEKKKWKTLKEELVNKK